MSYALKIVAKEEIVTSYKIKWNDCNDIAVIENSLGVESVDVQSLTESVDVWVDDVGAFKKGNYVLGLKIEHTDYQIVGKALLLGLDAESGQTRGLTDTEIEWINQHVQIWAKPIGFIQ